MTQGTRLEKHQDGSASLARWTGTLGVFVPAVAIPIYPIWLVPATHTSGADIARWAADHHDRLVATQVLYTVGVGLWIVFGAALWTRLRSQLPAESPLPTGFSLGIIGMVTLILSGFTAFDLLLYVRDPHRGGTGMLCHCGLPISGAAAINCAHRSRRGRRTCSPHDRVHRTQRSSVAARSSDGLGYTPAALHLDRPHRKDCSATPLKEMRRRPVRPA